MSGDKSRYNLQPCTEHGGLMCHVNVDGRHVSPALCPCQPDKLSLYCPIDLHNPALFVAEELSRIETQVQPEDRERALNNFIGRHSTTGRLF